MRKLSSRKSSSVSQKSSKTKSVISKSNIEEVTISQTVFSEYKLSWTHCTILMKINNDEERDFYKIESAENNWSVRELQRQYNSSLYERVALSKNKKKVKELGKKGQWINEP